MPSRTPDGILFPFFLCHCCTIERRETMRFSLGKIIALCGAAAMVVPLAACGTTQSETPDGSGKTVVRFGLGITILKLMLRFS